MIALLSTRKLSDPDLGFHLNGGKWIAEHKAIPHKDISTYTVPDHEYIDLHWGFQIFIYSLYRLTGYAGLSLLVLFLSLAMMALILRSHRLAGITPFISLIVLITGFLIMEFRIVLRPELFSYLFILALMSLMDAYYSGARQRLLYFIPVIMLVWCNVHSLFILGHFILLAYFAGIWLRDGKPDKKLFLWIFLSVIICFINPYGWKALVFPITLLTRFESGNIFNQHIREFIPFFAQEKFFVKDYLFLILSLVGLFVCIITRKQRKLHEWIMLIGFLVLGFKAVRNMPLFVLVAMVVFSKALNELMGYKTSGPVSVLMRQKLPVWSGTIILLTVIPLIISIRVYTDAWYAGTNSYDKTGLGIDSVQQPVKVSDYLLTNSLDGRILNSLPFGGFLSWKLSQPVFIDGRLEVIGESLYKELTDSWHGNLDHLLIKYKPDLIVYNYRKYFPWTIQMIRMSEWRVIYLDGNAVVFARNGYRDDIPSLSFALLPGQFKLKANRSDEEILRILSQDPPDKLQTWLHGLWIRQDYFGPQYLNIASFCMQQQDLVTAEIFFLENLHLTHGGTDIVYYAMADIYMARRDIRKAGICFKRILQFDPENQIARKALRGTV